MKTPDFSSSDDDIDSSAILWLIERKEGFTPERAREFDSWLRADSRHAEAVACFDTSMSLLEELREEEPPLLVAEPESVAGKSSGVFGRFRLPGWGVVGLAASLMLGLWFSWPWFDSNHYVQNVVTDIHGFRQVDLPDGSIVKVNVASDLQIDFTPTQRNVTLRSGEAYFEVSSDRNRPFVVVADGVAVRAVGTAFNVRVANADIEVLVTEGHVELARPAGSAGRTSAPLPVLGAGEQAAVARQSDADSPPRIGKAAPRVVRETLSWHSREMRFLDVPLQEIIAQFNLRNETQLVIVDEALHTRKMGGSFALDQVESFVRLLEQEGGVVSERRGKNEILLRAGR